MAAPSLAARRDPDLLPGAPVVIYDGKCRFCLAQVKRLLSFDKGEKFAMISLHDARVATRYPDLSFDQLMSQMYVVDPAGGRHGGIEAVKYITRQLKILWPLAAILHVPGTGWFWTKCYRIVARIVTVSPANTPATATPAAFTSVS